MVVHETALKNVDSSNLDKCHQCLLNFQNLTTIWVMITIKLKCQIIILGKLPSLLPYSSNISFTLLFIIFHLKLHRNLRNILIDFILRIHNSLREISLKASLASFKPPSLTIFFSLIHFIFPLVKLEFLQN